MYHNEGHGRFRDVTKQLGLQSSGWAQGVCAGDTIMTVIQIYSSPTGAQIISTETWAASGLKM